MTDWIGALMTPTARRVLVTAALAATLGTALGACGDTPRATPTTPIVTVTSTASPTSAAPTSTEQPTDGGATAVDGLTDTDSTGTGVASCDPDAGVPPTVSADMRRIAPPITGSTWKVSSVGGNPCSGLGWVEVFPVAATTGPPRQLLIYHDGQFLGTGIRCQTRYPEYVTEPQGDRIPVTYRFPDPSDPLQATTQNPVGVANVTFRWNGSRIVMEGSLPYAITRGQC
jgi:hypothetical protein